MLETKSEMTVKTLNDLKGAGFLEKIKSVIPSSMDTNFPQKFITSFFFYLKKNSMVASCEVTSLARCLIESASLGLMPSTTFGHIYLVPYGKEASLLIGYQGLMELLLRDEEIALIEPRIVREGDEFKVAYGSESTIVHIPAFIKGAPITHVYAILRYKNGQSQFEVMTKDEIDKIKSLAKTDRFWGKWYEQMAIKTVIKKLAKYIRKSAIYGKALEIDNTESDPAAGTRTFENTEDFLMDKLENENAN